MIQIIKRYKIVNCFRQVLKKFRKLLDSPLASKSKKIKIEVVPVATLQFSSYVSSSSVKIRRL